MEGAVLLVWVLFIIMPGDIANVPIGPPMLSFEECIEKKERLGVPLPMACFPKKMSWNDLT